MGRRGLGERPPGARSPGATRPGRTPPGATQRGPTASSSKPHGVYLSSHSGPRSRGPLFVERHTSIEGFRAGPDPFGGRPGSGNRPTLHRLDVYLRLRACVRGSRNEGEEKGRCGTHERQKVVIARTRFGGAARAASRVRTRFGDVAAVRAGIAVSFAHSSLRHGGGSFGIRDRQRLRYSARAAAVSRHTFRPNCAMRSRRTLARRSTSSSRAARTERPPASTGSSPATTTRAL